MSARPDRPGGDTAALALTAATDRPERDESRGPSPCGQVLDGLVHPGLVLGRDTRRVVHEEAVVGAPDGVEGVLRLLAVQGADGATHVRATCVERSAGRGELLVAPGQCRVGGQRGEVEVLLEQLVEGDPEADPGGVDGARQGLRVLGDDRAREGVTDHLHVRIRGADRLVGDVPPLGGLRVDDGLGLEHVVGHEARDGVQREPGRGRDELRELGHVLLGQVLHGPIAELLVVRGHTRRVVHEEAVVGAPDGVEGVLRVGAVDRPDHRADVGAVGVQQATVGLELLGVTAQRGTRGLHGQDDVLAKLQVERGPQVGRRAQHVAAARDRARRRHGHGRHRRRGLRTDGARGAEDEHAARERRDDPVSFHALISIRGPLRGCADVAGLPLVCTQAVLRWMDVQPWFSPWATSSVAVPSAPTAERPHPVADRRHSLCRRMPLGVRKTFGRGPTLSRDSPTSWLPVTTAGCERIARSCFPSG